MKVTAVFHGILSDWVGVPRAEIELSGGTLSELLNEIKIRYGANMPEQLWNEEGKTFHKAVWAMRGEEKITDPGAGLADGEEIKFFLTLAGG